jgi:hypothetical protein
MGNANALMQSDDWAALISDARARKCYADMDSLPKDFFIPKGPAYTPLPGKASSNMRGCGQLGIIDIDHRICTWSPGQGHLQKMMRSRVR